MADQTEPPKTAYRVLKRVTEEELAALWEARAGGETTDLELFVLEPNEYTGNVKRAVYDELGEGEYIKIAARSLDPFVARKKEVVTFK
jgi:hypothetical protein